jgi:hypothetical protein
MVPFHARIGLAVYGRALAVSARLIFQPLLQGSIDKFGEFYKNIKVWYLFKFRL